MANFFSASYWKARFFKALPTAQADANPGSMSATLTGFGEIAGAALTSVSIVNEVELDGHDGWPRRKAPIVEDMAELRRRWAEEDANRQEAARRQDADRTARRKAIAKALGTEPEPEPKTAIEISQERLKALTALLDYPKPVLTIAKPSLIDFKARRERKAAIEADRKAREEARALAERIRQEIRDYDDAIILLLLAA